MPDLRNRTLPVPASATASIQKLLQLSLAVLLLLSGTMFAVAEHGPTGWLTIPIAVAGLVLVDWTKTIQLPVMVANVLGVVAFVLAAMEFFSESIEGRLLAFGHLLLYLSWIQMLQPKGATQIWWLCAMSSLQAAASSVLTNEMWLAFALGGYVLWALWTLSVFSLYRAGRTAEEGWQRSPGAARPERKEPLGPLESAKSAALAGPEGPSSSRSAVRAHATESWISPRFVAGVLLNGALSILLGLLIFLLTPRVSIGQFSLRDAPTGPLGRPLTGFTEQVTLGDMGEILESPEPVFDVQMTDVQSRQPVDVEQYMQRLGYSAPLFRGAVLGTYENGRWSPPMIDDENTSRTGIVFGDFKFVRQEYRLQPIGTRTLFSAHYPLACEGYGQHRYMGINQDNLHRTIRVEQRSDSAPTLSTVFEYVVYTSATGSEHPWMASSGWRAWREQQNRYVLTLLPRGLGRLRELAEQIARPAQRPPLTDAEAARQLMFHLRDSGTYRYTLNAAVSDPSIDPVEDFLFNRQEGHCEYFASALALLLRAVGIPTRMVSGFKGGELNTGSGRFEVRQLHAHTWVEAYVDGGWQVLDPTPGARDESVRQRQTSTFTLVDLRASLRQWWVTAVMLTGRQQNQLIYTPIREAAEEWIAAIREQKLGTVIAETARELLRSPEKWISGPGFVAAFLLGLLTAGSVWVIRRVWSAIRRLLRARRLSIHGSDAPTVRFYERFCRLAARCGQVRARSQTQLEFADAVRRQWWSDAVTADLKPVSPDLPSVGDSLPAELTEAFYRVRFGRQTLDAGELARLEGELDDLEKRLQHRDGNQRERDHPEDEGRRPAAR